MSTLLAELERRALELPEDQRATLANNILSSIEPLANPSIDALWEKEIIVRLERLDSGQTRLHPASQVFTELDRRLSL